MYTNDEFLTIESNNSQGYARMVEFKNWTAACITYGPGFERKNFSQASRHNDTDETFVLICGSASLLVGEPHSLIEVPMDNGKFYNVKKGTWHALFVSEDAKLIVSENSNTCPENSDVCKEVAISNKPWYEEDQLSVYLDIKEHKDIGYKRIVEFEDWTIAQINYSANFDEENFERVERHNNTDEVFVLIAGEASLMVGTPESLVRVEMEKGVFYNVKKGAWHHIFLSKDAKIVIVENSDTGSSNSDLYYF